MLAIICGHLEDRDSVNIPEGIPKRMPSELAAPQEAKPESRFPRLIANLKTRPVVKCAVLKGIRIKSLAITLHPLFLTDKGSTDIYIIICFLIVCYSSTACVFHKCCHYPGDGASRTSV